MKDPQKSRALQACRLLLDVIAEKEHTTIDKCDLNEAAQAAREAIQRNK